VPWPGPWHPSAGGDPAVRGPRSRGRGQPSAVDGCGAGGERRGLGLDRGAEASLERHELVGRRVGSQRAGDGEDLPPGLVRLAPVPVEGRGERLRAPQRRVERSGQQVGVAVGIADAVPGDGVAVVEGVADQGPSRAPRPADLVGEPHRAAHRRCPPGGPQAGGERRRDMLEHAVEPMGRVVGAPAGRERHVGRRTHPDAGLAGVRGEDAGECPVAQEELDARPGDAPVVGVVRRAVGRPGIDDRRAHRPGDLRAQAVGAHHDVGVDIHGLAVGAAGDQTHHPPRSVPAQAGDRRAQPQRGAGVGRGPGDDGVEGVAAGCDQEVDAGRVLDPAGLRALGGVERHVADGGGAARQDIAQQAPALELDHAAAGDGVGRERVARERRSVEHDHVVAHAGQQHGRGGAAGAGADDGDVVSGAVGSAHRVVSWLSRGGVVRLRPGL
jgi:hypothetical protein